MLLAGKDQREDGVLPGALPSRCFLPDASCPRISQGPDDNGDMSGVRGSGVRYCSFLKPIGQGTHREVKERPWREHVSLGAELA